MKRRRSRSVGRRASSRPHDAGGRAKHPILGQRQDMASLLPNLPSLTEGTALERMVEPTTLPPPLEAETFYGHLPIAAPRVFRLYSMMLRDFCTAGKNIVLVGMPGAGKTTVGRRLASIHRVDFIDTDVEIERYTQMSISDIFHTQGETAFRNIEKNLIIDLLNNRKGVVVATGGGAFMDDTLRQTIKDVGISIWMKASPQVLLKRIRRCDHRPMLQTDNPHQVLIDLLAKREEFYAHADVTVDVGNLPHSRDRAVSSILYAIENFLRKKNTTGYI